ncbi:MAG: metallophosphoesterase [Phycisphaerae bacterium]|nr:metallophosphoesterase [Phycisphaerae bacterium]MCZ2398532.1 metallophosphoesterase [Phycisphaerae bacterium]
MRLCFCSDLHGRAPLYSQLERLLRAERPELLILGGDMFPDGDLDDPRAVQGRFVHERFIPWVRRMRTELAGMQVSCILGNHDWLFSKDYLAEYHNQGAIVLLTHRAPWVLDGVAFIGYSRTPPTPYWVKDFERLDMPDDPPPEMGGAIWDRVTQQPRPAEPETYFVPQTSLQSELAGAARPAPPWIFVCHAPPHASMLDRLPHVDHPVGSRAVREFIEQRQPLCSLHGHIHESPTVTGAYYDLIGATTSINPGQSSSRLHAVLLETGNVKGSLQHRVLA